MVAADKDPAVVRFEKIALSEYRPVQIRQVVKIFFQGSDIVANNAVAGSE